MDDLGRDEVAVELGTLGHVQALNGSDTLPI